MARPTIGFPWFSLYEGVTSFRAQNLAYASPNAMQYRARDFLTLANNSATGSETQASVDKDILRLAACGVDYLLMFGTIGMDSLFPPYGTAPITPSPEWSGFNAAVNRYFASPYKSLVKFCVVVSFDATRIARLTGHQLTGSDPSDWAIARDWFVTRVSDPNYMTVNVGGIDRPLVYTYQPGTCVPACWATAAAMKTDFDDLRARITTARANPYWVALGDLGSTTFVFDAKSNYAGVWTNNPGATTGQTWSDFVGRQEATWASDAAILAQIVPGCSVGFDFRPLSNLGAITGSYQDFGGSEANTPTPNWVQQPTAANIKAHVQAANAYVVANPSICPANTVMIYGPSEALEGTTDLLPMWGDKGAYLRSLATILGQRDRSAAYRAHGDSLVLR